MQINFLRALDVSDLLFKQLFLGWEVFFFVLGLAGFDFELRLDFDLILNEILALLDFDLWQGFILSKGGVVLLYYLAIVVVGDALVLV